MTRWASVDVSPLHDTWKDLCWRWEVNQLSTVPFIPKPDSVVRRTWWLKGSGQYGWMFLHLRAQNAHLRVDLLISHCRLYVFCLWYHTDTHSRGSSLLQPRCKTPKEENQECSLLQLKTYNAPFSGFRTHTSFRINSPSAPALSRVTGTECVSASKSFFTLAIFFEEKT